MLKGAVIIALRVPFNGKAEIVGVTVVRKPEDSW
jgi:hypothetical protein